jgi:3-hydroxy-D-aspartate aldolase
MNPPPAEIGVPVAEVETPALIIDLDALDRNIAKMAEFASAAGVRVRPHAQVDCDCVAADRSRMPAERGE